MQHALLSRNRHLLKQWRGPNRGWMPLRCPGVLEPRLLLERGHLVEHRAHVLVGLGLGVGLVRCRVRGRGRGRGRGRARGRGWGRVRDEIRVRVRANLDEVAHLLGQQVLVRVKGEGYRDGIHGEGSGLGLRLELGLG